MLLIGLTPQANNLFCIHFGDAPTLIFSKTAPLYLGQIFVSLISTFILPTFNLGGTLPTFNVGGNFRPSQAHISLAIPMCDSASCPRLGRMENSICVSFPSVFISSNSNARMVKRSANSLGDFFVPDNFLSQL